MRETEFKNYLDWSINQGNALYFLFYCILQVWYASTLGRNKSKFFQFSLFLSPIKQKENPCFSDVFRGNRKLTLAGKWLKANSSCSFVAPFLFVDTELFSTWILCFYCRRCTCVWFFTTPLKFYSIHNYDLCVRFRLIFPFYNRLETEGSRFSNIFRGYRK